MWRWRDSGCGLCGVLLWAAEHLGSNPKETGSLGIQCLSKPLMQPRSALAHLQAASHPPDLSWPALGCASESKAFHSLSRPPDKDAR